MFQHTRMSAGFSDAMARQRQPIARAIRTKLETVRVARLATLDADQRPHLIPICFAFDGKFFYSAIDRKPKRVAPKRLTRLRNIARRPKVALLIDHYEENWLCLWYVLVRGEAKLVSSPPERRRALKLLRKKYPQYAGDMLQDDGPILRIRPQRVTAWGNI